MPPHINSTEEDAEKLRIELKSDKVAIRNKAFVKLYTLLTTKLQELRDIFTQYDDEDFSMDAMFFSAHEGNSPFNFVTNFKK